MTAATQETTGTWDGPISNGLLLAMEPERREKVIAQLSPVVRARLAQLCVLGAERELDQADKKTGRNAGFAPRLRDKAKTHLRLAAQLLAE